MPILRYFSFKFQLEKCLQALPNNNKAPDEPDIQVLDDPEIPWTVHAAKIKRLVDYSHQCDGIMTKALLLEIIYTKELLADVLEAISNRESNVKIGMVQPDADFISLRHPADRPHALGDQKRQNFIENGPYQPKLKSYPNSPDIANKKQCGFSSGWFKEYAPLKYSLKQDTASCFICCLFETGIEEGSF